MIYTFYTKSYFPYARKLAKSFKPMDVEVCGYEIPDKGIWMENCMIRSHIMAKLLTYDYWFLDSDIQAISKNKNDYELFNTSCNTIDLILNHRPNRPDYDCFSAGIIYVGTPKGHETIKRWSEICYADSNPDSFLREQLYLKQAIDQIQPHWVPLNDNYNYVPPKGQPYTKKKLIEKGVVLLHDPASRVTQTKLAKQPKQG